MLARFGRPANYKYAPILWFARSVTFWSQLCQARDLSSSLDNNYLEVLAGDDHGLVT
jgi:hypothetical protein